MPIHVVKKVVGVVAFDLSRYILYSDHLNIFAIGYFGIGAYMLSFITAYAAKNDIHERRQCIAMILMHKTLDSTGTRAYHRDHTTNIVHIFFF